MSILFFFVFTASSLLFLLGLFNPEKSLWWYKGERTKRLSRKCYGWTVLVSFILIGVFNPKKKDNNISENINKIEHKEPINYSESDKSMGSNSDKRVHYDIDGNRTVVTQKEISEKDIDRQFSSWDGSHMKLVKAVKNAMNDPNSYEHVQTSYIREGKVLFVKMDYRGKNGFGALVKTSVLGQVDANTGDVITVNNID